MKALMSSFEAGQNFISASFIYAGGQTNAHDENSEELMKVIINADDFGFSESVNWGIIEGHKNGIVISTTIMVNMPAVEHALNLLKQNSETNEHIIL